MTELWKGDARWELAERVASSRSFQKTTRLRDFLLYVCQQTLAGVPAKLTEHEIGCAVFGRSPEYSPSEDSIVRVQARQLRLRLDEFFQNEGSAEPMVIEIPRGGYQAVFREVVPAAGEAEEESGRRARLTGVAPWVLSGVLGAVCVVLAVLLMFRGNLRTAPEPRMLSAVFSRDHATSVVLPDSAFGLLQSTMNATLSLEDYLRPGYPAVTGRPTAAGEAPPLGLLAGRPFTSFGGAVIASRVGGLAERHGWRCEIRHARDLTARHLTEGNHVLVGSQMSNPWVSLYEPQFAFRSEWDAAHRVIRFRNATPVAGEDATYASAGEQAFASVALLKRAPGSREGNVLVLQGTNIEATEAAWDFAADSARQELVLRTVKGVDLEGGYQLEVLLETTALAGSHRDAKVRAVRVRGLEAGKLSARR